MLLTKYWWFMAELRGEVHHAVSTERVPRFWSVNYGKHDKVQEHVTDIFSKGMLSL